MKFDEVLFTLYTVILEVKKFTPCFTALIRASVSLDLQNNCFIFQEDLLLSRFTMNLNAEALFFNVLRLFKLGDTSVCYFGGG